MSAIAPSFLLKIERAEKHLIDLETEIARYVDSHPYEVRVAREGKRKTNVPRFYFTHQPDVFIALIAADFIYNVRSALDHLAAALVPSTNRRSVMFPIFWRGVWDDGPPGENAERTKARERWKTYTRSMRPEAVAILKTLQPPELGPDDPHLHMLDIVNRISNKDRHSQLAVLTTGLAEVHVTWTLRNGRVIVGRDTLADAYPQGIAAFVDGTDIHMIDDAVDVQVRGTACVTIRVGAPLDDVGIPVAFRRLLAYVRDSVVTPLIPYLHVPRGR